jgi:glucose/arabinose dehydrogenase
MRAVCSWIWAPRPTPARRRIACRCRRDHQPCTEKETRGGIWRYDANKLDQHFSAAERYASGIRNGEGMALDKEGRLFVTQHGRDQLLQDWPKLYSPQRGPLLPAEEVMELKEGADYGWPECYFDGFQKKLVLAPEYGGDGGKTVGLCADRTAPMAFYPAHFAPNALLIDLNSHFPAVYREGAFIAFHGSWNRTPIAQDGYDVVFQPMKAGKVSGPTLCSPTALPAHRRSRGERPSVPRVWPLGLMDHCMSRTTCTAESGALLTRELVPRSWRRRRSRPQSQPRPPRGKAAA